MITRRQFSFFGLVFMLVSRWPFLIRAQKQPAPVPAQQPAIKTVESLYNSGQKLMMMTENEEGRQYYAGEHRRFEYPKKQIIVIYRFDRFETFTLNMKTHEYTSSFDIGMMTATIKFESHSYSELPAASSQLLPYDPALFKIPADFHLKHS